MTDLFDLPFDDDTEPDAPAPSPPDRSPPAPGRRIWSVSELTAAIRIRLESEYPEIWVEGELSNTRLWKTGHLYFTLKDGGAQIRGVMFRSARRYLKFEPEDGQHVVARGRIGVYEPKGEYQLVCEHLEPHGLGALQLAFEQLRGRLEDEGLFDATRKRPLPTLPRKIGIVTSLDGAALRDIINVLRRRYPNLHLVIGPARVQGDGAAREIVRSLDQLARIPDVDVLIVGRGGGSIEDLWAFNEEPVARAIAAARVPVISAVGHETDYTIADFVADLRAPTPSAAAELVVARKDQMIDRISRSETAIRTAVGERLQRRRAEVQQLERRPGLAGFEARLVLQGRYVSELGHQLSHRLRSTVSVRRRRSETLRSRLEALDLRRRLGRVRSRLVAAHTRLRHSAERNVGQRDARVRAAVGRLETLSPLAVLSRGYAVCWTADRSTAVRDASTVLPGEVVHVRLHRGELECEVTKNE